MDRWEEILSVIDESLNTKGKRHIVGGILMSAAMLFAGLAFTVITLRNDDEDETYGRQSN